ncbi:hypothetical protein ACLRDC_02225 [Gluconacetobacter sacchari]|uniref:hypothetical protein n=1 Tax=Gluconacetobacter sacchari TaxID=92759 RepID=UPI0039B6C2C6
MNGTYPCRTRQTIPVSYRAAALAARMAANSEAAFHCGHACEKARIAPDLIDEARGGIPFQPALERRGLAGAFLAHDVKCLVVWRDHGRPWIGGAGRVMHDQGRDRATSRRVLIFIGPEPVI